MLTPRMTLSSLTTALLFAALSSGAAAAPTCADLIRSKTYDCTVKRDNGVEFDDCYDFKSPGVLSDDFDLFIIEAGFSLACSCEAAGRFRQPRFNESRRFLCVSSNPELVGLQLAVEGLAPNRRRIRGDVESDSGSSFVFRCTRISACPLARSRRHGEDLTPYH